MIAYVDGSVLLRIVLGQKGRLREWSKIREGVASALVEVECLRTLDRLRLSHAVPHDVLAERRSTIYRLTAEMTIVPISPPILARASQPMPTPLGTLDAIHLATALLWMERSGDLVMATHDDALGTAAKACGLSVVGS